MKTLGRLLLAFLVPLAVAAAVFLLPAARRKDEHVRTREAGAGREQGPAERTPAESRAVASALASESAAGRPALRAAEDDDGSPSDERADLSDLYGTYHPFFARGDLNGDGTLDFAQAFIETGGGGWFHVAVFFGKADGSFEPPVWVERSVSLAPGDLSIERTILTIVPDLSLDSARRHRWDPVQARFVDAEADAPGADAEESGANDPPRLRI